MKTSNVLVALGFCPKTTSAYLKICELARPQPRPTVRVSARTVMPVIGTRVAVAALLPHAIGAATLTRRGEIAEIDRSSVRARDTPAFYDRLDRTTTFDSAERTG